MTTEAQAIVRIAMIGFGEVGQTFVCDLAARPGVAIAVWDILFSSGAGSVFAGAARALGAVPASSAGEALEGVDVVICAVTADQAEPVARQCAPLLRAGQIYLDVNSAAPSTKCRAAEAVQAAGADYVEGAVMAPVLKPRLAVPILAGGPKAAAAAELLNGLGMNLTPVATEHGRASAMKLCRSIVIKGLEALMVECAAASERWDVQEQVFRSLAGTYPSIDWAGLAADMRERVATHGVRRAAEMREAAEMLTGLGIDPGLALAVAGVQQRNARPKDLASRQAA